MCEGKISALLIFSWCSSARQSALRFFVQAEDILREVTGSNPVITTNRLSKASIAEAKLGFHTAAMYHTVYGRLSLKKFKRMLKCATKLKINFNIMIKRLKNSKTVEWVLRIAVAGEFMGHGIFALQAKAGWIPYFETFGISAAAAKMILPVIGLMDVILAIMVLTRLVPALLLWMALWGFATALIRPISGGSWWDFVERSANWGAPLALMLLHFGWPKKLKDWFK